MAMGGSAPTDGNGMSTRERWDGCPSVFCFEVECPRDGVWATRQGKTRELSGKPSMQEGMMDDDERFRPYG